MKIYLLIGTRPNFIKITQFKSVCGEYYPDAELRIIHTGQHYDEKMADVFFRQFNLNPDYFLNIQSTSQNSQVAEIMIKLEELCIKIGLPDVMLVPGDVNSTLAGALFANKSGIKLGHIEAGLRSFDKSMPEEFNRILTDQMADIFFVTEPSGKQHLINEGVLENKIHFVGNTMIDTMLFFEPQIESSNILKHLKLEGCEFVLLTMHRPANVDNKEELKKLFDLIDGLSIRYKIVFPIHPRTIKNIESFGLESRLKNNIQLICTEPLDYFGFQKLIKSCSFIVTDSGGIQEESTYRLKPCITLRPNTERPITVDIGTNTLLPFNTQAIKECVSEIELGTYKKGAIPEYWDGKSTLRIVEALMKS